MEQHEFEIFTHPDFKDQAKQYHEKYDMINIVATGDLKYSKRNLRHYSSRICRFCGLGYPDVPFSNYSHLLSK